MKFSGEVEDKYVRDLLSNVNFVLSWNKGEPIVIDALGIPDGLQPDKRQIIIDMVNSAKDSMIKTVRSVSILFEDIIQTSGEHSSKKIENRLNYFTVLDRDEGTRSNYFFIRNALLKKRDLYKGTKYLNSTGYLFSKKNGLLYLDNARIISIMTGDSVTIFVKYQDCKGVLIPKTIRMTENKANSEVTIDTITLSPDSE
jgi:hypothetical protein